MLFRSLRENDFAAWSAAKSFSRSGLSSTRSPTRCGCGSNTVIRSLRYLISVSILNIGMYMAMMITPTISPTPIIISGSMIEVSDWIAASTSSS